MLNNPSIGGTKLPILTNPGMAGDLLTGKQLIDQDGQIVTGTLNVPGITWKKVGAISSSTHFNLSAYGSGKYIVVGQKGEAWYTSDFISWSATTLPSNPNYSFIVYGRGKFVAAAYHATAVTDVDNISWETTDLSQVANFTAAESIAYGAGKFVMPIPDRTGVTFVLYSEDGKNWSQATIPIPYTIGPIAYGNGRFILLSQGKGAYSEDGVTWYQFTPGITPTYLIFGGNRFLALNSSSDQVSTSTNGLNWTSFTSINIQISNGMVCYGAGKFIASDSIGDIDYSYDGKVWYPSSGFKSDPVRLASTLCYGNGKFLAINSDNASFYSG